MDDMIDNMMDNEMSDDEMDDEMSDDEMDDGVEIELIVAMMDEGDIFTLGFRTGLTVVLNKLENHLCPSAYDERVRCFWAGELIGHFHIEDEAGAVLATFTLSNRDNTFHHVYNVDEDWIYARATGKIDTGKVPEEAAIEIEISHRTA